MPTLGQTLINNLLPEDMRDYKRVWDKKSVAAVMNELQKKHPEKYKDVVHSLYDLGHKVVTSYGKQAGISPDDFEKSDDLRLMMGGLEAQVDKIYQDVGLTAKQKDDKVVALVSGSVQPFTDRTLDDAVKRDNSLGMQVTSGTRGNKSQLAQSVIGDMLVADSKNKPIPIPIFHGYGEGVDPSEYWAASYGARKGAIDIQKGTAKAGFFSKQMVAAAHRLRVTEYDCGTTNGVGNASDDSDIIGTVLSRDSGEYKAGDIIDGDMYRSISKQGGSILTRSPLTCQSKNGVCQLCAGSRDKGRLPDIGDNIGISAVQALCLDENTSVRMADGSCKPIRDIVIGDMVVGCSAAGVSKPVRVLNVYNNGKKPCYETIFNNTTTNTLQHVISTLDHKILRIRPHSTEPAANGQPTIAEISPIKAPTDTSVYYQAKMADNSGLSDFVSQVVLGDRNTYDIEVDHPDHLFVLENGLVVSNSEPITQSQLCLAEGTLVRMADWTVKTIEDIEPGDEVFGADTEGRTFPTKVVTRYENGFKDCVSTLLSDADGYDHIELVSTPDHKVLARAVYAESPKKAVTAIIPISEECETYSIGLVTLRDYLESPKIQHAASRYRYYRREQTPIGSVPTFDIEVDHPDHLFVLANGLVVSNSSKHTGGVVGQTAGAVEGFDAINQLVQIPKSFKNEASIAATDGIVAKIEDAPQGGKYIFIGEESHYVSPDQEIQVKVGEPIEAGDPLSDGIPNPEKIVRYKGIGEGRKAFVDIFKKTLTNSGVNVNRRNVELLARGVINHVRITDIDGPNGSVMDDIVEYDTLAKNYEPRADSYMEKANLANNAYLEKPVMHYSIGTRITPKVQKYLKDTGVTEITVNKNPPAFEPSMVRIMENLSNTDDWQTRLGGFYLGKGLDKAVQRGGTSKVVGNQSFIPALAYGKDFGKSNPAGGF